MYALVFALALVLAGCSKDTPTSSAPKVNPGSDGITSPPGLFPDPSELPVQGLNTVGRPDLYDVAADVLWGSILGNEKQDAALVRALDGMDVLISGVMEIDGKEQLYLGIDRADFAKHDIDNLRAVLEKRFPSIPIYIEASDGVDLLTGNDADEPVPVDVFSDDFGGNLDAWNSSSGWAVQPFDDYPVPGETDGNTVAVCAGTCSLTMQIDLTDYTSADLSFHRWLDDSLLAGSHLTVAVQESRTLASYDKEAGDGVWHYGTFSLDEYAGKEVTLRFTARVTFDLSSLFGGGSTRFVALDNVTVQGVRSATDDTPDLVVQRVSVNADSADSGANIRIGYTVKNTGTSVIRNSVVSVYRHAEETDTPATGGETAATRTRAYVNANSSYGTFATVKTPSVSEDTDMHYYVCVSAADAVHCNGPVTVTVKKQVVVEEPEEEETPEPEPTEEPDNTPEETPVEVPAEDPADDNKPTTIINTPTNDYKETSYPKPPYESCYHAPERKHVMAGDVLLPQPLTGEILGRTGVYSCATLTLGGVETKNGTKGFVVSGHMVADVDEKWGQLIYISDHLINNVAVGHGTYMRGYDMGRLIGMVSKLSNTGREGGEKILGADAAFAAYPQPKTSRCSATWSGRGETFCLDLGDNQVERAVPMRIRGKGREVYTVVGSQKPSEGLSVQMTGAVSGVFGETETDGRRILTTVGDVDHMYQYRYTATIVKESIGGDSGAPVYTTPDANKHVRIVGIHIGEMGITGNERFVFSSWHDVTDALDLKSID